MTNYIKLIPFLILVACSSDDKPLSSVDSVEAEDRVSLINPPLQTDVKSYNYLIDNSRDTVIYHETGSCISIPANSFVNESGECIKDIIQLSYREFHDELDILVSGIKMDYDSAGIHADFQSAGMFDIRAQFNNQEAFVAHDKSITVSMASFTEGSNYSFYHLDEDKQDWDYKGIKVPVKNERKFDELAKLKMPEKPVLPEKALLSEQLIDLNVDFSKNPELKSFHGLMWKEVLTGKTKIEEFSSQDWTYVSVDKKENTELYYQLTCKNQSSELKMVIRPALIGKNYEKALAEFKKKEEEYTESKNFVTKAKERLSRQGDLLRVFSVNKMGVYNWDRRCTWPDKILLSANFRIKGKNYPIDQVLMVCGGDRSVITYKKGDWDKFAFSYSNKNYLICIIDAETVAYLDTEGFNNQVRGKKKNVDFELEISPWKITSMQDLQDIIHEI